jgi:hypothetical protein
LSLGWRAAAAVAAVLLAGAGACAADGEQTAPSTTTTTSSSTSTTTTTATSTTVATTSTTLRADRLDWDGVRFDYGILDRIDRTEDGRTIVVFDRGQLPGGTENTEAADLTEEPVVVGNTDLGMVNDSTRLRRYVAARDVEVLRIANLRRTCADLEDAEEPRWERITVDDVIENDLAAELQQVSLTFDGDGLVRRIRLSSSC